MDLGRIMQINDLVAHHLVVRDVEINVVVRTKPGGTPVDFTHLTEGVADLQPITDLIWPIDLDRYATNDSGKKILSSETENDRDYAGACQQSFQLCLGVIAVTQNEKQDNEENKSSDYLTQKMRNRCLSFLLEIKVPNVTINESDNERGAQQNGSRSNVITPRRINSVDRDCGVKG